jgi:hypothetical protein
LSVRSECLAALANPGAAFVGDDELREFFETADRIAQLL